MKKKETTPNLIKEGQIIINNRDKAQAFKEILVDCFSEQSDPLFDLKFKKEIQENVEEFRINDSS